jgi:hypothetical protein
MNTRDSTACRLLTGIIVGVVLLVHKGGLAAEEALPSIDTSVYQSYLREFSTRTGVCSLLVADWAVPLVDQHMAPHGSSARLEDCIGNLVIQDSICSRLDSTMVVSLPRAWRRSVRIDRFRLDTPMVSFYHRSPSGRDRLVSEAAHPRQFVLSFTCVVMSRDRRQAIFACSLHSTSIPSDQAWIVVALLDERGRWVVRREIDVGYR